MKGSRVAVLLAALAVAASSAAGCEVVAGIESLQLAPDAGSDTQSTGAPGSASGSAFGTSSGSGGETSSGSSGGSSGGVSGADAQTSSGTIGGPTASGGAPDASSSSSSSSASSGASEAGGHGSSSGSTSSSSSSSSSSGATSSSSTSSGGVELIDDMETATGILPMVGGRGGAWFVYNDGTPSGTELPAPNSNGTLLPTMLASPVTHLERSQYGMDIHGSGFTTWGAGMGFNINDPPGMSRAPYDATKYTGFLFFALVGSAGSGTPSPTTVLRFNVPTFATDPMGNVCGSGCNDHFGKTLSLTTSWQKFQVPFSDLTQEGFGTPATWDASKIYGCLWQTSANKTFDVWVDDVYFTTP